MAAAKHRAGRGVAPRDPCVEQPIAKRGNGKAAEQQPRAQLQQFPSSDASINGRFHVISSTDDDSAIAPWSVR